MTIKEIAHLLIKSERNAHLDQTDVLIDIFESLVNEIAMLKKQVKKLEKGSNK